MSFVSSAILIAYLWSLPFLANWFDANADRSLCNTPAHLIKCTNGVDFEEITGLKRGCPCSSGIFGQSACPLGTGGYSISSYIAAAPATGMTAVLSVLPIGFTWVHILRCPVIHSLPRGSSSWRTLMFTTVAFQICFGLIIGGTFCIFPTSHFLAFLGMSVFATMHFFQLLDLHRQHFHYEITNTLLTLGLFRMGVVGCVGFLVTGFYISASEVPSLLTGWDHVPFVFECMIPTAMFLITPLLMQFEHHGNHGGRRVWPSQQ